MVIDLEELKAHILAYAEQAARMAQEHQDRGDDDFDLGFNDGQEQAARSILVTIEKMEQYGPGYADWGNQVEHLDDENCPHDGCLCRNCAIVRGIIEREAEQ